MNFNYKYLKWFLILLLSIFLRTSYSLANNNLKVDLLNDELRDQFCRFYSEDHLMNMRDNIMERTGKRIPVPPARNTLKRSHIGENRFLFS